MLLFSARYLVYRLHASRLQHKRNTFYDAVYQNTALNVLPGVLAFVGGWTWVCVDDDCKGCYFCDFYLVCLKVDRCVYLGCNQKESEHGCYLAFTLTPGAFIVRRWNLGAYIHFSRHLGNWSGRSSLRSRLIG